MKLREALINQAPSLALLLAAAAEIAYLDARVAQLQAPALVEAAVPRETASEHTDALIGEAIQAFPIASDLTTRAALRWVALRSAERAAHTSVTQLAMIERLRGESIVLRAMLRQADEVLASIADNDMEAYSEFRTLRQDIAAALDPSSRDCQQMSIVAERGAV